jgi:hypothetical protein
MPKRNSLKKIKQTKNLAEQAEDMNNQAKQYAAQGKYAEAEPLYKRALEILENSLGSDHPKTEIARKNLKALHEENAKIDKKSNDPERERKVYHLINFYSPYKEDQEERAKELREKWGVSTKVIKSNDAWALCWHADNKMDEFKASIEILRPHLNQRIWPPLSGMRIPGILKAADKLILEIYTYETLEQERKEALLIEISNLRRGFRVDNSSGTSCSSYKRPTDRKIKINEML